MILFSVRLHTVPLSLSRLTCATVLEVNEEWSDSEDSEDPARKIRALENKLAQAQHELMEYRAIVNRQLDLDTVRAEEPAKPPRDDDTHYFDSYAENGMRCDRHERMLVHPNLPRYSRRHDQ